MPKPIQDPFRSWSAAVAGASSAVLPSQLGTPTSSASTSICRAGTLDRGFWENGSADATHEKLHWVRAAARDRREQPELNIDVFAQVTHGPPRHASRHWRQTFGTTPDVLGESPHALIGTVEEIAELISERRERFGFSYVTFTHDVMHQLGPLVTRLTGT